MLSIEPGLRMAAEKPIHSRSCVIYAWSEHKSYHAITFESRELEPQATFEPFLTVSIDEGQLLFDALFDAGYRRVDDADRTGEIEANHAHIRDLQVALHGQSSFSVRLLDAMIGGGDDEA